MEKYTVGTSIMQFADAQNLFKPFLLSIGLHVESVRPTAMLNVNETRVKLKQGHSNVDWIRTHRKHDSKGSSSSVETVHSVHSAHSVHSETSRTGLGRAGRNDEPTLSSSQKTLAHSNHTAAGRPFQSSLTLSGQLSKCL